MDNDVYYKIYCSERLNWKLTVVCMQWFDENGYYEDRFMTDSDGHVLRFDREDNAIQWLLKNAKRDKINPEYLANVKFIRESFLR